MALEARIPIKVGRRTYQPGDRLTQEHEIEMRRRPGFSLLIEDGDLVQVKDTPNDPLPPPSPPDPDPVDPVVEALNAVLEPVEAQAEIKSEFACPHCDYSTDKKVNLNAHIRRNHRSRKGKNTRKR